MISRERERLLWGVSVVILIAISVWSWAGVGRYQFRSQIEGHLFDTQVFDTRTGNIVTYVFRSGEWRRSDLASGGAFVKTAPPAPAPSGWNVVKSEPDAPAPVKP